MRAVLPVWSMPWLARLRSRDAAAGILAMLACAAVFGSTAWQVQTARTIALSEARAEAGNLARVIAEQANADFSLADVLLASLADRVQREGVSASSLVRLQRSMAERLAGGLHVRAIAAYSADGSLLAGTMPQVIDWPDRIGAADLAFARTHPTGGLRLAAARAGSGLVQRQIIISRGFELAGGGLGGVLVALIDTGGFDSVSSRLHVGPASAVGLRVDDGTSPARAADLAAQGSDSVALQAYSWRGSAGRGDIAAPAGGTAWLTGLYAVERYPLVAFVALAQTDVLACWRANAFCDAVVATMVATGLGIFGWVLACQIKRAEMLLQTVNAQLQQTAMQDPLTSIGNRRLFDSVLQKEQRRAARTEQPLALLMLDVDYFKPFNDAYGHPAGDACLQAIATSIAKLAQRPADLAVRFGGEEFGLLLPETDTAGALALAERAREAVRQLQIPHGGGLDGIVTISVGTAVVWPQPPDGAGADLVQLADAALYAAKEQGRNCACLSPLGSVLPSDSGADSWFNPPTRLSSSKQ